MEMKADMFRKILQEHPYLIDTAFVRSRSEAEKIVHAKHFPSYAAFIKRAKLKSKLPPNAWKPFEQALEIHEKSH
jgi:hypothetical protein